MNAKILAILCICASLGGCMTTKWSYPGPQREANILSFECRQKGNMASIGSGQMAGFVSEMTYQDCMRAYGFVPQN